MWWCLFDLPTCYFSGIGSAFFVLAYSWCDFFNTTIYIESCTALLQQYDLTLKWATQHNNLLSSFIECLITYFYLVHHHAFVRCTTCLVYAVMLLFGVCNHAFIWCMQSCFYLVYATMLLDVRYHAFIWCTKSCFYGVRNHAFIWCMVLKLKFAST